jgi:hypothetical protein
MDAGAALTPRITTRSTVLPRPRKPAPALVEEVRVPWLKVSCRSENADLVLCTHTDTDTQTHSHGGEVQRQRPIFHKARGHHHRRVRIAFPALRHSVCPQALPHTRSNINNQANAVAHGKKQTKGDRGGTGVSQNRTALNGSRGEGASRVRGLCAMSLHYPTNGTTPR